RDDLRRPLAGRRPPGDLLGPRRLFLTGLIVFSVASLVGATSLSARMLVAARAVQGIRAALIAPTAPGVAALVMGYREALVLAAGLAMTAFFVSLALIPSDRPRRPSTRVPPSRSAALPN